MSPCVGRSRRGAPYPALFTIARTIRWRAVAAAKAGGRGRPQTNAVNTKVTKEVVKMGKALFDNLGKFKQGERKKPSEQLEKFLRKYAKEAPELKTTMPKKVDVMRENGLICS